MGNLPFMKLLVSSWPWIRSMPASGSVVCLHPVWIHTKFFKILDTDSQYSAPERGELFFV